jgi:hypothetical protein
LLSITDPSFTPQKEVDLVTAEEFEKLDESQAALFLATRFRNFARGGFPPEPALQLAVHPEIDVPIENDERDPDAATAA